MCRERFALHQNGIRHGKPFHFHWLFSLLVISTFVLHLHTYQNYTNMVEFEQKFVVLFSVFCFVFWQISNSRYIKDKVWCVLKNNENRYNQRREKKSKEKKRKWKSSCQQIAMLSTNHHVHMCVQYTSIFDLPSLVCYYYYYSFCCSRSENFNKSLLVVWPHCHIARGTQNMGWQQKDTLQRYSLSLSRSHSPSLHLKNFQWWKFVWMD